MVSYYNSLPYAQKHGSNLGYPPGHQPWFPSNYHPPNHQFLGDVDSHHQPHMYYNPHMFHQTGTPDWHAADAFSQAAQQSGHHHHAHHHMLQSSAAGGASNTQLNESTSSAGGTDNHHLGDGLPSPPITVSGSEISSPGAPVSASSPHAHLNNSQSSTSNLNRSASPARSPAYYDWMKKPSYPAQPTPGKTRTKDKYRVVYTDYQRLELEKEYCTSRYITIRRKAELAVTLQLSERQVKIWFQNRRAKERKQSKKRDEPMILGQSPDLANYMDTKPKLEPGLHLPHSLHQMNPMAMGMPPMSLHHHSVLHHGHHPLAVPPPPQHLHHHHQTHPSQLTASVGSLSM